MEIKYQLEIIVSPLDHSIVAMIFAEHRILLRFLYDGLEILRLISVVRGFHARQLSMSSTCMVIQ